MWLLKYYKAYYQLSSHSTFQSHLSKASVHNVLFKMSCIRSPVWQPDPRWNQSQTDVFSCPPLLPWVRSRPSSPECFYLSVLSKCQNILLTISNCLLWWEISVSFKDQITHAVSAKLKWILSTFAEVSFTLYLRRMFSLIKFIQER